MRTYPQVSGIALPPTRGEFAKVTAVVDFGKRLVAIPRCCQQFLFRHSAYASHQATGSHFSVASYWGYAAVDVR